MIASLLFHDVVRDGQLGQSGFVGPVANRYKLSTQAFESHLDTIQACGVPVTLPDDGVSAAARKVCMLTFDDGGVTALTEIAPRIESRGWRGCFFVTTGQVGQAGFLSREQVSELRARGHVVGSHSHTHPAMISSMPRHEILDEWRRSCDLIADWTGAQTTTASIPSGFYSDTVADTAAACGIKLLFTSEPSVQWATRNGLRLAGRLQIVDKTSSSTIGRLARSDRTLLLQRTAVWNGKKILKRVGGGAYRQVSTWLFDKRN